MHKFTWYYNRLKLMTPGEIAWRITALVQALADRVRVPLGIRPSIKKLVADVPLRDVCASFALSDVHPGGWNNSVRADESAWARTLEDKASRLLEHKMSYLGLEDIYLGKDINWHKDYNSNKVAAVKPCSSVDYRDFSSVGDCKLVWEINRHHHLVILGRAYRATGDIKYAKEILAQIDSWMKSNPFGYGMNWRSPLELAVRLINWVWAVDLIRDSNLIQGDFKTEFLDTVYLHCWDIARKYSYGSSANNHLVGEAAGVFVASCYFTGLPEMDKWRAESRDILCREIMEQTYSDGCIKEQALGYQFFVLGFYLFAGIVGKKAGIDFPAPYWGRIEKMTEFISVLREGGAGLPMFGDCDDGYVLDLGDGPHDTSALLGIGAVLFNRPDFARSAQSYPQSVRWLLESESRGKFSELSGNVENKKLHSHAFMESGIYLLQCEQSTARSKISVFFDCGELGYGSIAAHGHADALSITLRAYETEVFIDPGTYDYFTYPEWRNYFRSTRAHNTVTIDGENQSELTGPFMWSRHAKSRCLAWEANANGGRITAEHDGYMCLTDPVIHRRTVDLNGDDGVLMITDTIQAKKNHNVSIYFHLSELCRIVKIENTKIFVDVDGKGVLLMETDPRLAVEINYGKESPICGWRSKGYHERAKINTIRIHGDSQGMCDFVTKVALIEQSLLRDVA